MVTEASIALVELVGITMYEPENTLLPAALTMPAVLMLPPVILPVALTLVKVPTDVILGCAAVVTVPAVVAAPVNAPVNAVADTLLNPVMVVTVAPSVSGVDPSVTDALAKRACAKVPDEMLVALILDTLAPDPLSVPTKLPPVMLPEADTLAAVTAADVTKLPPVMLPVTLTVVPV